MYVISHLQSYWEITSDDYLAYIGKYVVGLGPWKDTIVPAAGNYLMPPSDLVARAHAHNLQVHHLFVGNVCYANHLHMKTMETPIWTTGSRSKGGRMGSGRVEVQKCDYLIQRRVVNCKITPLLMPLGS